MADSSFSDEILETIVGKITAWLSLSTPWVSIQACSSQIYYSNELKAHLAFDPFFGSNISPSAILCLPTEVTVCWNPAADQET